MIVHIGRSWEPDQHLEIACPCPKAPCGLVLMSGTNDPDIIYCEQHDPAEARTMRQIHNDTHCPSMDHAISEEAAAQWREWAVEQGAEVVDTSDLFR